MEKELKRVKVYTDGACSGNPGKGGWGAILLHGETEKELSGFEGHTTNNRMELTAAIEGLKALKYHCDVELYSDSSYLVNAFTNKWIDSWKLNGWRNSSKDEVKNRDLWEQLTDLTGIHRVKWIKVKGHSDNEYNNRCDKLATGEIKKHAEKNDDSGDSDGESDINN